MTERLAFYRLMDRTSLERVALGEGWALQQIVDRDAEHPYEQIWLAGSCAVHYLEDQFLQRAYVIIKGPAEMEVRQTITDNLATLDVVRAVEDYRRADAVSDRLSALGLLAATAPDVSVADVVGCLISALEDPDAQVRHAALIACAYISWSDLQLPVAERAARDPDPRLADAASQLAARLAAPPE